MGFVGVKSDKYIPALSHGYQVSIKIHKVFENEVRSFVLKTTFAVTNT